MITQLQCKYIMGLDYRPYIMKPSKNDQTHSNIGPFHYPPDYHFTRKSHPLIHF